MNKHILLLWFQCQGQSSCLPTLVCSVAFTLSMASFSFFFSIEFLSVSQFYYTSRKVMQSLKIFHNKMKSLEDRKQFVSIVYFVTQLLTPYFTLSAIFQVFTTMFLKQVILHSLLKVSCLFVFRALSRLSCSPVTFGSSSMFRFRWCLFCPSIQWITGKCFKSFFFLFEIERFQLVSWLAEQPICN